MKFGFVTCVQLGLSCIEKILEIGGKLDLLITLHDHKAVNKSGRIFLDKVSEEHKIPLLKINHINDRNVKETIKEKKIDWLFVIGWSQIADKEVLDAPTRGCIGIHPTLLPKGRGRAAIPWAIIKGLEKTGVTMFKLDEGVDTGEIIGQLEIPLDPSETSGTLYQKANDAHIKLIGEIFPKLETNEIVLKSQNENDATYWEGRKPKDGLLNNNMSVIEAERLVRATTHPYPGAYIEEGDKRIIFWRAHIEDRNSKVYSNPTVLLRDGVLVADEWEVLDIVD
ncbi:MAG: formyltransferase family protein [Bacteroidales bacterium]|nr:formyltransferase family protein [Bacteroidales bacterium]